MIVLVMKTKTHTFIALLLAASVAGLVGGMNPTDAVTAISDGFGNTLKSTGIIIGLGVMLGGILEKTGAAGGLGAALKVFLNANLKSGIETVLDLIEFDSLLEGADLVITGEGRMDWQSAFGKVPSGVGLRSKAKNIPVIAIVGGMGKGVQNIYDYGVDSIIPTVNGPMPLEEAMERAEELYADVADRLFRIVKAMSCK